MLHFVHNGKTIKLLNDKAITLESLVSLEIEHLKVQNLICNLADQYSQLAPSYNTEKLHILAAKAIHGEVKISADSQSLIYFSDRKHNHSDVVSYTVRSDEGCVGSLALVISQEDDTLGEDISNKDDLSDEIVSSIVMKATYIKDGVTIVDRFSIDIGSLGKGLLHSNPNNRNFEIDLDESAPLEFYQPKKTNSVFVDKDLINPSFYIAYDETFDKPNRRKKTTTKKSRRKKA